MKKKSSRMRAEVEDRFLSRLVIEDENNDDALTEKIDEEEHRDMNRLIEDDEEEPVNIEDTHCLDKNSVDESINLPKNNMSLDQCSICNMENRNAKKLRTYNKNYHYEEFGNNEQKTSGSHNVADDITVTRNINIYCITKKNKLTENKDTEEHCNKKEMEEHCQIYHSDKQNQDEGIHPILLQLIYINKEQPDTTTNLVLRSDEIDRFRSEPEETCNIKRMENIGNTIVPTVTSRKRKLEGLKITIAKEVHLIHDIKGLSNRKKKCNKVLKENKKQKSKQIQKSVVQKLALRRKRKCKVGPGCLGCLTPECLICRFCLDRPSRGGSFTLRQKCEQRTCRTEGGT